MSDTTLDIQCEAEIQEIDQHYSQVIEERRADLEEQHRRQDDLAPIRDAVWSLCGLIEDSEYFSCWESMANELFSPIERTFNEIDESISALEYKISDLEDARERKKQSTIQRYDQMMQDADN